MTRKKITRTPRYRPYVLTAIDAAKFSIESFNRIDGYHSQQASLIFCSQAWELLAKAVWVKKGNIINLKNGKTITAEVAVNALEHKWKIISTGENQTIQQLISLRNEALHNILPKIDTEIVVHLLYYSLQTFHVVVNELFKTHASKFDRNFISISFTEHTFFSHRVGKLFSSARKFDEKNNKVLFLLDRGCSFANDENSKQMQDYETWKKQVKQMPKKARPGRRLTIAKYMQEQEDVRFVPILTRRGHRPVITTEKTKDPTAPIFRVNTDPDIDFPYFTQKLSEILGKSRNFTAKMCYKLGVRENADYCLMAKQSSRGGKVPRYNDKAVTFLKEYLEIHSDYNPYL